MADAAEEGASGGSSADGMPVILAQGIRMILTIVAAVITVFLLNWRLACLSLVAIPLLAATGRLFGPRAARASMQRQRQLARAITTLQENLGAQPVVKVFGLVNGTPDFHHQPAVINGCSQLLADVFGGEAGLFLLHQDMGGDVHEHRARVLAAGFRLRPPLHPDGFAVVLAAKLQHGATGVRAAAD